VTVTTPASAFDYLLAVANGQTKAAGLKRPTVAALQQAAKALGLADRIDHAPYGYHVGKGWDVAPAQTSNLQPPIYWQPLPVPLTLQPLAPVAR
jgi:hypothetical protein